MEPRVRLFEVEHGAEIFLGQHKLKTAAVAFSRDGDYLMSCGWDRELRCWDLRSRQRVFTVPDAGNDLDWNLEGTNARWLSGMANSRRTPLRGRPA